MSKDKLVLPRRVVFDFRYNPVPVFSDVRGQLVALHGFKDLNWRVHENNILIISPSEKTQIIINPDRYNFSSEYIPNLGFLRSKLEKYTDGLKKLLQINKVQRIGLKSTFIKSVQGEFPDLVTRYLKIFSRFNNEDWKALGGKPVDIGYPINFKEGESFINTMQGPMKKEQLETQFFQFKGDFPKLACFFDIDIFCFPDKEFDKIHLQKFISNGLKKSQKQAQTAFNFLEHK